MKNELLTVWLALGPAAFLAPLIAGAYLGRDKASSPPASSRAADIWHLDVPKTCDEHCERWKRKHIERCWHERDALEAEKRSQDESRSYYQAVSAAAGIAVAAAVVATINVVGPILAAVLLLTAAVIMVIASFYLGRSIAARKEAQRARHAANTTRIQEDLIATSMSANCDPDVVEKCRGQLEPC